MPSRPNLKKARLARNLTQQRLAELVGLNRTAITNLERGKINGSEDTWRKLAAHLGKRVEHLWQLAD